MTDGLKRRACLLWPIKQAYGNRMSWADLIVLAGEVGLELMGFVTFGCGGGRVDCWQLEADIDWGIDWGNDWGNETIWLGDGRDGGDRELEQPLAAVQMGLIDVNPEAPHDVPISVASGRDLRETFSHMASNDREPVADFVTAWSKVMNLYRFDCLPDCLLDCLLDCKPD